MRDWQGCTFARVLEFNGSEDELVELANSLRDGAICGTEVLDGVRSELLLVDRRRYEVAFAFVRIDE